MVERRRPGRRLRSVRVGTTALAVLVVGLATVTGLAILGYLFRDSLLGELETSARLRAGELAADIAAGANPSQLDTEDLLVQLVDQSGRVITSSPNVAGLPMLGWPEPDDAQEVTAPLDPGTYLIVTEPVPAEGSPTLVVGVSTEGVTESTWAIVGLFAIGLPALLLVVAATTWSVVGRALAPVEAVRREVAAISGSELHRRVPEPAGDDEIARLARTMNEMLGRLEDAQVRQRRFVADASHELRSPIASIRQHAEVALAHPDRSSLAGLADTVLTESLRIQRLVSDLLLLAAADERSPNRRHHPVDLDDLMFAVAGDLRASGALQVSTSAVSAGRVMGEETGLRRVLTNLAENASRHARARIDFGLTERDGTVLLTVDDDGPGIPEPDRQRVLQRFVRLDQARNRDAGGSGLGLAIVAELVAGYSGRIEITDSPLGGARIAIRFPWCADFPQRIGMSQ